MSHDASLKFDVSLAHRHFSTDCFNRTWTLMEMVNRTETDTLAMVLCATASLWHWTQRADCTDQNLSISHWQVSRAYALAGQGENALQHGHQSLKLAEGSPPFYIGYAHEAIARAAWVLKDRERFADHLRQAQHWADQVTDAQERQWLEKDLKSLQFQSVTPPRTSAI